MKALSTRIVLSLSFLSCIAYAEPGRVVNYEARAQTLKQVGTELSQELNRKILIDPSLEKEIVLIKARNVAESDLLEQISTAMSAEWTQTEKGILLHRPKDLSTRIERNDRQKVAKRIRGLLDISRADEDLIYYLGPFQRAVKLESRQPNLKTLYQTLLTKATLYFQTQSEILDTILTQLDEERISSIPDRGIMVISLKPNQYQTTFKSDLLEEILRLKGKLSLLAGEISGVQSQIVKAENIPAENLGWMITETFPRLDDLRVTTRRLNQFNYHLQISDPSLVDSEYKLNAEWFLELAGPDTQEEILDQPKPKLRLPFRLNDPKIIVPKDAVLQLFERLKREREKIETVEGYQVQPLLQSALKQVLSDPVKVDPLSLHESEVFLALASDQEANIVANLPDQLWTMWSVTTEFKSQSLEDALALLCDRQVIELEQKNGWILVKSRYPSLTTYARLDRVAFRKAIESEMANLGLSLADQITLANSYPDRSPALSGFLISTLLPSFSPGAYSTTKLSKFDYLRFLGSLTPSQVAQAESENRLLYRTLSKQQQKIFKICLASYYDIKKLIPRRPRNYAVLDLFLDRETREELSFLGLRDLGLVPGPYTDITDAEPHLIRSGEFSYQNSYENVVYPITANLSGVLTRSFSASSIAAFQEMSASPQFLKHSGVSSPAMSGPFALGERQFVDLTFSVAGYGSKYSLSESKFGKDPVEWKDLPAQFLADVTRLRQAYKAGIESYLNAFADDPVTP